jgi:hypothetical protein
MKAEALTSAVFEALHAGYSRNWPAPAKPPPKSATPLRWLPATPDRLMLDSVAGSLVHTPASLPLTLLAPTVIEPWPR